MDFSSNYKGLWIPVFVLNNKEMNLAEKAAYSIIYNLWENKKPCFMSKEYFAKILSMTEKGARVALIRLRMKGFISWKKMRLDVEEGIKDRCIYTIVNDIKPQNDNSVVSNETEGNKVSKIQEQSAEYKKDTCKELVNNEHSNEYQPFIDDRESIIEKEIFIDAFPNEINHLLKEIRVKFNEEINRDMSVEEREQTIRDNYTGSALNDLLDMPGRKIGFIPVYMDDVYYYVKENNKLSAKILKDYFISKSKKKMVTEKLFNTYKKILIIDAGIESNHQFIQWFKR